MSRSRRFFAERKTENRFLSGPIRYSPVSIGLIGGIFEVMRSPCNGPGEVRDMLGSAYYHQCYRGDACELPDVFEGEAVKTMRASQNDKKSLCGIDRGVAKHRGQMGERGRQAERARTHGSQTCLERGAGRTQRPLIVRNLSRDSGAFL